MEKIDGYYEWYSRPETFGIGRLPARAGFISCGSAEEALAAKKENRRLLPLDSKWRFRFFPDYPSSRKCVGFARADFNSGAWETVDIPHSFYRRGGSEVYEPPVPPFAPQFSNPVGLYIKKFRLPRSWHGKRITLCLEGAGSAYYIYVNGEKLFYDEGCFERREFDVTDFVTEGVNTLALEVYSISAESWLQCGVFRGGGIFRSVYLRMNEEVYIADMNITAAPHENMTDGIFSLEAEIIGCSENCRLEAELFDGDIRVGFASSYVSAYQKTKLQTTVAAIEPWSPEKPKLYKTLITLYRENEATEFISAEIGFRRIEFRGSKLFVNGKKTLLRGVCGGKIAQAACGSDTELMERAAALIKGCGANAFISPCAPCSEGWYTVCDRAGIMVIDECSVSAYSGNQCAERISALLPGVSSMWESVCLDRANSLRQLSKNRTCVIAFSAGNLPKGKTAEKLCGFLREADAARPVFGRENTAEYCDTVIAAQISAAEKPLIVVSSDISVLTEAENSNVCGIFFGEIEPEAENFAEPSRVHDTLFFEDFSPRPEYRALKRCFSPVRFYDIDAEHGVVKIENGYSNTNLGEFLLFWRQNCAGEILREGSEVFSLAPDSTGVLDLELNRLTGSEWYLELSFRERESGEIRAERQFTVNGGKALPRAAAKAGEVTVHEEWGGFTVRSGGFEIRFTRPDGRLISARYMGEELFSAPLSLCFIPENSRASEYLWASIGENAVCKIESITETANNAEISLTFALPTYPESGGRLVYTFNASGFRADLEFAPAENLAPLFAAGLTLPLAPAFKNVRYWGREHSLMPRAADINTFFGVYESDAQEISAEGGLRFMSDVRSISLCADKFTLTAVACEKMNAELSLGGADEGISLCLCSERNANGVYRLSAEIILAE